MVFLVAFLFNKELAINSGLTPSDEKSTWQLNIYCFMHMIVRDIIMIIVVSSEHIISNGRKDAIRAYERIFKQKLV